MCPQHLLSHWKYRFPDKVMFLWQNAKRPEPRQDLILLFTLSIICGAFSSAWVYMYLYTILYVYHGHGESFCFTVHTLYCKAAGFFCYRPAVIRFGVV